MTADPDYSLIGRSDLFLLVFVHFKKKSQKSTSPRVEILSSCEASLNSLFTMSIVGVCAY